MDIIQAITQRRAVRAFLDKPVSKETVLKILDIAKWAPSGVNAQPWYVTVVGPNAIQKIAHEICAARDNNIAENPDYLYYPRQWIEPYKSRRKACGAALYGALQIKMKETQKRKAAWYRNYSFFDAPCGLIFHLPKHFEKGSWMDMGMFLQNIMLAAQAFGLATCPQASMAEYPDIIRQLLNIPKEHDIVCGMALGYADWSKAVNQYRTTRESAESFTKYVD
ncbi:MAG TPA: nitroreductase [Gammaproteobacteria bacterium]|nr:nitroreductase [Gammaproteobacteria bacterium]